jgi:hypothetical protein
MPTPRTSGRDSQAAQAHLLVRISDIVLQRSLWGRLRWLLLGR